MYRPALRSTARSAARRATATTKTTTNTNTAAATSRRFASTAPADKPRTWKGAAARWGLALGAVYWYNTSPVFAEEPAGRTVTAPSHFSDSDVTTVDAVIAEKRRSAAAQQQARAAAAESLAPSSSSNKPAGRDADPAPPSGPASASAKTENPGAPGTYPEAGNGQAGGASGSPASGSPGALEEEADQQGAFNPETGEINWDCPCLGGMAHGPCGEEFRSAFSCFVYSNEEPKGMDCIDKFQHMQDCFRKYPEIYGNELGDDEDEAGSNDGKSNDNDNDNSKAPKSPATDKKQETTTSSTATSTGEETQSFTPATPSSEHEAPLTTKAVPEAPENVTPVQSFDATAANKGQ